MIEYLGQFGAAAYALSGLPLLWQVYKQGHARGIAGGTVVLILIGSTCLSVYVLGTYGWAWPVLLDYFMTIGVWSFIAYRKWRPQREYIS